MSILKSKVLFVLAGILLITAVLYFTLFRTQDQNKSIEMANFQLSENESLLLSFEMPSNYIITQDLSSSKWFEADSYTKKAVSPGLKGCTESSNGMTVGIGMMDRSFDPNLLPPDEFVEDRNAFAQNSSIDFETSTEVIDGRIFSRAESVDSNCEYAYSISYSGQVEGYITNFQFFFEGDYEENLAIIERVINSMDFKLE